MKGGEGRTASGDEVEKERIDVGYDAETQLSKSGVTFEAAEDELKGWPSGGSRLEGDLGERDFVVGMCVAVGLRLSASDRFSRSRAKAP